MNSLMIVFWRQFIVGFIAPFIIGLIAFSLWLATTLPADVASTPPVITVFPTKTPNATRLYDVKMLKDVGEAYMDYFGLAESDFAGMAAVGVNVIEGNFDICATDEDVQYFLDQSQKHHLSVVMPAGSGEAEWGYICDTEPRSGQKPAWQAESVTAWINKWRSHPAVYAWDTSNEAGGVLPNGGDDNYKLTLSQLQEAYKTVKQADPKHAVMVRMNGWYFYDNEDDFFRKGNPYGDKVADIVMVNAYSNVDEYFTDFVTTVVSRSRFAVQQINPKAQVIVALGVWNEPPLWHTPTQAELDQDVAQVKAFDAILGTAYFKYGAKGSEWYLPENSANGAARIWQQLGRLP